MKIIKPFFSSLVASNKKALILFSGTIISQLIPFLLSPVLTRIYNPDDFGLFGLYFSVTQIFSVFIAARYEMAIILPKEHKDGVNLLALSCLITSAISFLAFIPVFFFRNEIEILLNNKFSSSWIYLIPFSVFLTGITQAFINWFNRKEQYTAISISRVSRSGVTAGASVAWAFLPFKYAGLIIGDIIGQLIGLLYILVKFFHADKFLLKTVTNENMFSQAKRYSQFPKYNVASGLFEKIAGHLPVFFLTAFFGPIVAGFFTLSQRVISAPSAIVARAIGDVFRVEANAEFLETGGAKRIFNNTFKKLFFLSIVPFSILFFFAPSLFEFVFGNEWVKAGEYAQLMTVMFFLQFVTSPLSSMFLVAEKQKIDLFIQIFLVAALALCMYAGEKFLGGVETAIIIYTVVYSCKYLIEFSLSYHFSRGKN